MSAARTTSFGELLRQYRLAADLTQEALAERAGMSERAIRALERGHNRPQKDTARGLARAFELGGVDLEHFLSAAVPAPRRGVASTEPAPRLNGLPAPATALLGRDREVVEAVSLLARPDVRMLTLTGPGGVGKTSLALEVARRSSTELDSTAVFVPLASLSDPDLVLPAVARALDLTEGTHQSLLTRLIPALKTRRLVLLLDNFEHLLDAAPALEALRASCPTLRMVVTSRAPLRLRSEQIYPVPPLAIPSGYGSGQLTPPELDALSRVSAVRLFLERARGVRPDFALTPANGWAVAEICGNLDGLPLAIELAAARVAVLSPQALLVQLAHPLRLLTGGARDLPERQRTLRKAIGWSYDLLQWEEQALFRRLGVFAGGCELEAVEAICTQGLSTGALDGVSALAEANLLVAAEADEPRFRMLETIREFALERLETAGEDDQIRRRHAAYYLAFGERSRDLFMGAHQAEQFRRVDRELDNIRAALGWSRECGDMKTALGLAAALFYYWYLRGYRREGRAWLERALALSPADARTPERAAALAASGGLGNLLGDFAGARRRLEESAAIWRELGDRRGLSDALTHLSITYGTLGEGARARAAGEETLAMAREDGDLVHLGLTLHGMGVGVAWERRDFVTAQALYEESLAAFRAIGSPSGTALVVNSLGDLARLQGNFSAAREYYEESLELAMDLASKSQQAIARHNLGHTLHSLGYEREARDSFCQSLLLFRDMGDTRGVAECLAGLACLEAAGNPRRTAQWFGAARAATAAIGTELSASNEAHYAAALATARIGLGEKEFDATPAAGSISLEEAVAEALEVELD